MLPCVYAKIALLPDGRRVVLSRTPPGCTLAPGTVTETVTVERVERERRNGYCLVYKPVKAVFPARACELLDAIEAGETPRALLLGPPGTGKSLFVKLAARVAPVYVVEIEPESMLSKYVGETEKNVKRKIEEAERNQPSLIAVDEADLFVQERSLAGGDDPVANVSANIVRMLLRKLQEWSDTKARVGFLASSNRAVKAIDTALIRGERLEVVYFPLPTRESIRLLAELYGKELRDEEITRLLRKALSFANIVEYLREGRVKEFQPVNFAYVEYGEKVEMRMRLEADARLVIAEEPPLGYKLAALIASSQFDKPVLLATDLRRIADVFMLGRSMEIPIAIPYSSLADVTSVMGYDYPYPIFYVGQGWRLPYPRLRLETIENLARGGRRSVYRALGCEKASNRDELERCLSGVQVAR